GWWRDGGVLNASGTPIQAAVDNATAGETICVAAGSYKENVDIATPHLTLTGEGAGVVTVTAADSNDHVFKVIASYVNISGFNATGATTYNGIHLGSADHCNISENTASNNHYGISLDSSSNNTLTGNTASSNNNNGIYLYDSSNNTLTNNTANSNIIDGIYLCSSSNNMLTGNNASSNDNDGIELYKVSNYNTLTNNNCSNNTQWDIYITGSDSTFSNNTLNGTTISFTYSGDVSLKGMGSPAADPAGQQTIGKFINATNRSAGAWLFINFSYSDADVSGLDESRLAVWKHNGTTWLKDGWNGTRYLNTSGKVVGVNITSFSIFAPAAPEIGANYIPPDPTDLQNTTGEYWVNYTWSAGTGSNVTDSYNVLMNETWNNGTTDTFMNTPVGPSGWANITVFAYNASGTGTQSAGNVSDSVQAPAAPICNCTCGDICVNETGWWRDGGAFNASGTPIQAAVDNANAGETICVAADSYTENVNITTSHLTLRGEGADVVTVTAASSSDHVFNVTADYVNISGFNATGATGWPNAGIYLNSTDHCNISENTASSNYYGIQLYSSSNNTLANNTASSNGGGDDGYGIYLDYSSNNTLANNNCSNNYRGIYLDYSSNNTLTGNNVSNNEYGIYLYESSNNTLANNTANLNYGYNSYGIYLSVSSNNTLVNNTANSNYGGYGCGIYLSDSSNNTLANNTANSNYGDDGGCGIRLSDSSNNTLANNTANSNYGDDGGCGIRLSDSSNNTLANNTANSNYGDEDGYGIGLSHSSNNTLASNNCSNNDYGIGLSYSSNNNTLASNNCSNNTLWDIYIWSSDSTFTNNTLNGTTISFAYGGDVSLKGVGSPAANPAGQQT
ncbi:MAG: right-handed parallel beta-helix repeat-containing protein, partial [Methanosarcinales archaeon]|nr:right-handed parallel beta-helix repeat-containing protein [Methanosarcinales archaeon]